MKEIAESGLRNAELEEKKGKRKHGQSQGSWGNTSKYRRNGRRAQQLARRVTRRART